MSVCATWVVVVAADISTHLKSVQPSYWKKNKQVYQVYSNDFFFILTEHYNIGGITGVGGGSGGGGISFSYPHLWSIF